MPETVETFWPPPPDGLRAWRRRIGVFYAAAYGLALLLLAVGFSLYELSAGRFDVMQHARFLAIPAAAAALITLAFYVLLPRLTARHVTKTVTRTLPLAAGVLEEGEVLLAICPGMFLGPRTYRAGYLIVSDQRLLRLSHTTTGYGWAVLAQRATLSEVVVVRRRSNKNAVLSTILGSLGTDRGLAFTGEVGEQFFVTDQPILDPLCDWLSAQGISIGHRNDEDPARVERPPEVELTAAVIPGRGPRSWLVLGLRFAVLVGLGVAIAYLLDLARGPGALGPPLPPFVASRPGLATAQIQYMSATRLPRLTMRVDKFPLPPGPPRLLAEIRVVSAATQTSAGVVSRRICVYQVAVFGRRGVLRTRGQRRVVEWELLGAPGDSDAALIDAAQRRLSVPPGP